MVKLKKGTAVKKSREERIVTAVAYLIVILLTLLCLLPFMRVISQAFSSDVYVQSGNVVLFPRGLRSSMWSLCSALRRSCGHCGSRWHLPWYLR